MPPIPYALPLCCRVVQAHRALLPPAIPLRWLLKSANSYMPRQIPLFTRPLTIPSNKS